MGAVLHDNDTSDKALLFSNLCARLLELPVLTQKSAILHFLHRIVEPDHSDGFAQDGNGGAFNVEAARAALKNAPAPSRQPELPTHPKRSRSGAEEPLNGTVRRRQENNATAAPSNDIALDMNASQDSSPTEATLLHDLPFTLQGLSTTHLPFTDTPVLKLPPTLPLPLISLLHTLAEPSLLYRNLSGYVQDRDEGLVGQSLRAAIGGELRSYLGLIAALEGEIRRALTSANAANAGKSIGKIGVTLKRCVIWTREATMGLRLMSIMVAEAKSRSREF